MQIEAVFLSARRAQTKKGNPACYLSVSYLGQPVNLYMPAIPEAIAERLEVSGDIKGLLVPPDPFKVDIELGVRVFQGRMSLEVTSMKPVDD